MGATISLLAAVIGAIISIAGALFDLIYGTIRDIVMTIVGFFEKLVNRPALFFSLIVLAVATVLLVPVMLYPRTSIQVVDVAYECGHAIVDTIDSTWITVLRYGPPVIVRYTNDALEYAWVRFPIMFNETAEILPDPWWSRWATPDEGVAVLNVWWRVLVEEIPRVFVNIDPPIFPGDVPFPLWYELVTVMLGVPYFFIDVGTEFKDWATTWVNNTQFRDSCYYAHLTDASDARWVLRGCRWFRGGVCDAGEPPLYPGVGNEKSRPGYNETKHVLGLCTDDGCHDFLDNAMQRLVPLVDAYIAVPQGVFVWIEENVQYARMYNVCTVFAPKTACRDDITPGVSQYDGMTCDDYKDPTSPWFPRSLKDVLCVPVLNGTGDTIAIQLPTSVFPCELLLGCSDNATCALVDNQILFGGVQCSTVDGRTTHWDAYVCAETPGCVVTFPFLRNTIEGIDVIRAQVREVVGNLSESLACGLTWYKDLIATANLIFDSACEAGAGEIIGFVVRRVVPIFKAVDCLKPTLELIMRGPFASLLDAAYELYNAFMAAVGSVFTGTIFTGSCFYCLELLPIKENCTLASRAIGDCLQTLTGVNFPDDYSCADLQQCMPVAAAVCFDLPVGPSVPNRTCEVDFGPCSVRGEAKPCTVFAGCAAFSGPDPTACERCHNYTHDIVHAVFSTGLGRFAYDWAMIFSGNDTGVADDAEVFFVEAGNIVDCIVDTLKATFGLINLLIDGKCQATGAERYQYFVFGVARRFVGCWHGIVEMFREWGWTWGTEVLEGLLRVLDALVASVLSGEFLRSDCYHCSRLLNPANASAGWLYRDCGAFVGGACQAVRGQCGLGSVAPCDGCGSPCAGVQDCRQCPECGDRCDVCASVASDCTGCGIGCSICGNWTAECTSCTDAGRDLIDFAREVVVATTNATFDAFGFPDDSNVRRAFLRFENDVFDVLLCFVRMLQNLIAFFAVVGDAKCAMSPGRKSALLLADVFGRLFACLGQLVLALLDLVAGLIPGPFDTAEDLVLWILRNAPFIKDVIGWVLDIVADIDTMASCFAPPPSEPPPSDWDGYDFTACAAGWPFNQIPVGCSISSCLNASWTCMAYESPGGVPNTTLPREYFVLGWVVSDSTRKFAVGLGATVDFVVCRVSCIVNCKDCGTIWSKIGCFFRCLGDENYLCTYATYCLSGIVDDTAQYECPDRCAVCSTDETKVTCQALCFLSGGLSTPCTEDYQYLLDRCIDDAWLPIYQIYPPDRVCDAFYYQFAFKEIERNRSSWPAPYASCEAQCRTQPPGGTDCLFSDANENAPCENEPFGDRYAYLMCAAMCTIYPDLPPSQDKPSSALNCSVIQIDDPITEDDDDLPSLLGALCSLDGDPDADWRNWTAAVYFPDLYYSPPDVGELPCWSGESPLRSPLQNGGNRRRNRRLRTAEVDAEVLSTWVGALDDIGLPRDCACGRLLRSAAPGMVEELAATTDRPSSMVDGLAYQACHGALRAGIRSARGTDRSPFALVCPDAVAGSIGDFLSELRYVFSPSPSPGRGGGSGGGESVRERSRRARRRDAEVAKVARHVHIDIRESWNSPWLLRVLDAGRKARAAGTEREWAADVFIDLLQGSGERQTRAIQYRERRRNEDGDASGVVAAAESWTRRVWSAAAATSRRGGPVAPTEPVATTQPVEPALPTDRQLDLPRATRVELRKMRARDVVAKAGVATRKAIDEDRAKRPKGFPYSLAKPLEKTADDAVDYLAANNCSNMTDTIVDAIIDVLECDRPCQYNGTCIYNVFCLQIPEYLFTWPRFYTVVPERIEHDPLIVTKDCINAGYSRKGVPPFDLPFDYCTVADGQTRPLCPGCDYCEREYDTDRANFGTVFDTLMMLLNIIDWIVRNLTATEIVGGDTFEDMVHFSINLIIVALVATIVSVMIGLPGAFAIIPVGIFLVIHGQLAFAILYAVATFYVLLGSGFIPSVAVAFVLVAAFLALIFTETDLALVPDIVCCGVEVLLWLRANIRPFRVFWIDLLDALIVAADRSCYATDPWTIPLADFELFLINLAKLTALLLVLLLVYHLLLGLILRLLGRLLSLIVTIGRAWINLWLRFTLFSVQGRVDSLEDGLGANETRSWWNHLWVRRLSPTWLERIRRRQQRGQPTAAASAALAPAPPQPRQRPVPVPVAPGSRASGPGTLVHRSLLPQPQQQQQSQQPAAQEEVPRAAGGPQQTRRSWPWQRQKQKQRQRQRSNPGHDHQE